MELRELVLDDSHTCSARLDAYRQLHATGASAAREVLNTLLMSSYPSRMLGLLLAPRYGDVGTLRIVHRMLDHAAPTNDVESLNVAAKALQAAIQLDPDDSGKLLTRMLSLSPDCDVWKRIVIAAAVLAPRDHANAFCHALLGDADYRKWHSDANLVLAQLGNHDAIRSLEEQLDASDAERNLKSVVVLARAGSTAAKHLLIDLLERFQSLEVSRRNEVYLHILNLYGLEGSPSDAVRELLERLKEVSGQGIETRV